MNRRHSTPRRLFNGGLLTFFFAFTLMLVRYGRDVRRGYAKYHQEEASVSTALPASHAEAEKTIIYNFPGLSGRDSKHDAAHMDPYADLGVVKAMRYGKVIDVDEQARVIVADAVRDGVRRIGLSGQSMGGLVALSVARRIAEMDADVVIDFIVLYCTPFDIGSVNPEKLTAQDWLTFVLAYIPGIRYSGDANFLAQYPGHLLAKDIHGNLVNLHLLTDGNLKNLFRDMSTYYAEVNGPDKASISLIESEFNAIIGSSAAADLQGLMDAKARPKPLTILLQPVETRDLEHDHTVMSSISAERFGKAAADAEAPFTVLHIPGVRHASVGFTPMEFQAGLRDQVVPAITSYVSDRDAPHRSAV